MNWFRNRKTVTKLMIGFGLLAAMLCFVAYRGISTAQDINTKLSTMYERDLKGLSATKEANIDLISIGRAFRAALLSGDKAEIDRYRSEVETDKTKLNTNFDEGAKTMVTVEARRTAEETKAALSAYYSEVDEIMRLAQAGDVKGALARSISARQAANKADDQLTALANVGDKQAEQAYKDSAAAYSSSRSMLFTIGALGTILAILLGYIIAQMIARPLAAANSLVG